MATAVEDTSVLEEELTCPVCLDLYRDPRLLPCGHNFCLPCLRRLKSRSERGRLRCPECRQSHRCSVPWQKNFKLANIADSLRKRNRAEQRPDCRRQSPTHRAEGVRCDYCPPEAANTSKGSTAVKTCLKCEVSMCPEHLQPHLELPAFREHPLVEPLHDMKKRKCVEHDEMFRYYCLDEGSFLCNACTIEGGHSGHSIKTLKNAMRDMRDSLEKKLQKADRKIQRVERNMQDQDEVQRQNRSFLDESEQRVTALRETLRTRLEAFLTSMCQSVRDHEAEHNFSIEQNLTRITEDRSRLGDVHAGIEQLLREHDPFQFIKEYNVSAKRFHRLLKKPLCLPHSAPMDMDTLGSSMEDKMEEFVTDIRQQIISLIDALCAGNEGDEGVEDEEETEETEDEGSEEDEEDGEDEEEMRSEEEEEQDNSESTDEDYTPEEEDEEEEEAA
ncbi:E3 ubiquitin/ISG15 ligase TRIM25 [Astyanax mexicanus]|uniref:Tripartite motif containing 25 n=2 Tax=Astyanax mexicanus TaxID=7994 RepID=W5LG95_ASTMX|nr:E3 ubiquitin/ISG15 ligase TRIM25 [Astyanax mexicanus]KAG9260039.1 E3 ubiquitin/ISG15 ligase TRIM25-like [Astyanax mexicanus]